MKYFWTLLNFCEEWKSCISLMLQMQWFSSWPKGRLVKQTCLRKSITATKSRHSDCSPMSTTLHKSQICKLLANRKLCFSGSFEMSLQGSLAAGRRLNWNLYKYFNSENIRLDLKVCTFQILGKKWLLL